MAPELPETLREVAERAANVLAPEADLFEDNDAAGFRDALTQALRASLRHPARPVRAGMQLTADLVKIPVVSSLRWFGRSPQPPVEVDPKDRRFAAPAWDTNPLFYGIRLAYLAAARSARDIVGSATLEAEASRKAVVALDLLIDAVAPTNFLPTNPAALQRAFDTAGASLIKGVRNFVGDVRHNGGKPSQVDTSGFTVGENLACTPAKVVYRNELMELLQYEPQTPQVHATPLLCSPPWINKYYIMDLAPGRSFIEWAVQHGRTVFAISYKNPSAEMSHTTMDDYLVHGPQTAQVHAAPLLCSPPWINKYYIMDLAPGRSFIEWAVQHGRTVFAISYKNPSADMYDTTMDDYLVYGPQTALDVIEEITGADTIDIVGLCLGGAMTAITASYLTQDGDSRIGSLTLLNTMLDYAEPGALGVFTDLRTVERLEKKMLKAGRLEGETMAGTFDILRANDLIFNYVVSNWLMGQPPPAFDILAWNADSTRMPAAMHAFYLRNFYVDNNLAAGTMQIAGKTIDLSVIKNSTYVVSAINDHIVPWESAYKSVGLVSGPVRFVLGSGGHIAGIVSPPGPKAWHMVSEDELTPPSTGAEWRGVAQRRPGSWWEDWTVWSEAHSGRLQDPPPMGSANHPVLGDGPGGYVLT